MNHFRNTLFAGLALASVSLAATYNIDTAHSNAQFSVRHMAISNVKGEFNKVTGTVEYDPQNPKATKISAVVDVTTVNTRDEKRDGHLKSPDFFDVAKFPTMTFTSTKVEPAGKDKLKVEGDLTIHGVTKRVTLDVDGPSAELKDPWGGLRRGATATTKVNRKDFGLTWNAALETGGVLVGDEVTITIDIEVVKAAAAKTSD